MARTLFEHAHDDGESDFPAGGPFTISGEMFVLLPADWNGTSAIYIWLLAGENWVNVPMDITINAGADGEASNNHTQTVNDTNVSATSGDYEKWNVTTICSTVIAAMAAGDMVWIIVSEGDGINGYCIGVEIVESS